MLRFTQEEVRLQQLLRRVIVDPYSAASFLGWHWGHPEGDFDYDVTISEELGAVATFEQAGGNPSLELMTIQDFMEIANAEFTAVKSVFEPGNWYQTLGYEGRDIPKPTENQTLIEFVKHYTTPGATASRTAQGPPSLSPRMPKVMDPEKAELLWEFEYMVQNEGHTDAFHIVHDTDLSAVAWVWGFDDYFDPSLEHINELMSTADEYLGKYMTVEAIRKYKGYWGEFFLKYGMGDMELPDLETPAWPSNQAQKDAYLQQLDMYPDVEMRTYLAQYFTS